MRGPFAPHSQQTYAIAILALVSVGIAASILQGLLSFDPKIQVTGVVSIVLFVWTLVSVRNAVVLQKAQFVRDFISRLHTDKDLSFTFHYLVENYPDSYYEKWKHAPRPADIDAEQQRRPEGARLFDPEDVAFSGSEEARRLDALLGYFNVIGYHYWRGLIQMSDLATILGYHLQTLRSRRAVQDYLESIRVWWARRGRTGDARAIRPLYFLDRLLDDFAAFSLKHRQEIERMEMERL